MTKATYALLLIIGISFLSRRSAQADLSSSAAICTQSGSWAVSQTVSSNRNITTATTTSVKATAGTLRRVVVMTQVAAATIKFFDLASASCTGTPSSNPMGVMTLPPTASSPFSVEFHESFVNGICVLTSGATNLTVIYD